jgi:hypothetical protein
MSFGGTNTKLHIGETNILGLPPQSYMGGTLETEEYLFVMRCLEEKGLT